MARPKKINDKVVRKLEEAFSMGCTDGEACAYAEIGRSTLFDYIEENPEFSDRKETLKNMPSFKAKRIINTALDGEDLVTAHKVVDRKEGSKIKQEITGKDGSALENVWHIHPVSVVESGK